MSLAMNNWAKILDSVELILYYENTPIKSFTNKTCKFSDKILIFFFYISAQNIDCGYLLEPPWQGGSNEYPQSMLAEIRKIMYTPANPSFTIYIRSLRGSKLCFRDDIRCAMY